MSFWNSLKPMDNATMCSSKCSMNVNSIDSMAVPAGTPTPCHAEPDDPEFWGQRVIASASSVVKLLKERLTTQSGMADSAKVASSITTASKFEGNQMNTLEAEEPFALRERLVFRTNVPVFADALLYMQTSYRDAEIFINKSLVSDAEMTRLAREILGEAVRNSTDEERILLRCACREVYEALVLRHDFEIMTANPASRKLRTEAQLSGIASEEIRQLDLLEQVWKEHGIPNASEMAVLVEVAGHRFEYLAAWCKFIWNILSIT
ncbi:MAG: hypothetical protein LQ337_003347 [Flavoplaca oasis]|nr:MAG: hypothetical protein LQ337_003347 [Flavoplaca oasis]